MPESDAQERSPWPVGGPLHDMFHHDFAAMLRWQGEPVELTAGPGDEFFAPPVPQESDDTGPHDVRAEDCWRCDARCSATDVGLCGPCLADLRAERPLQPAIEWVTETVCNGVGDEVVSFVHATHDGPCVFFDHQCSCGRLDVGIVRDLDAEAEALMSPCTIVGDFTPWLPPSACDDDEAPWFEHTDVPPTMWPTVWLTIAVGFLADRVAAVVRWVRAR